MTVQELALSLGLVVDEDRDMLDVRAVAVFDQERNYRYWLERRWGSPWTMAFVMLNPSTADAFNLDQTVRRCLGFAKREGAGRLVVANLFALRSTDPGVLADHPDPVGPHADTFIDRVLGCDVIVAAWGAGGALHGRGVEVGRRLTEHRPLFRLGEPTLAGHPGHPRLLAGDTPLVAHHIPNPEESAP